jgi:RNA polymerase sigma factor (sigma-70 family)
LNKIVNNLDDFIYSQQDDAQTWGDFKKGIAAAFSYIYITYYRQLYNYGYTLYPDKELLKDSLQELFFELWRDREKLGTAYSIRVYLLVSFRRKLIAKINQDRKRKQLVQKEGQSEESYETKLIFTQQESEQKTQLNQALAKLPKRQKEAVYLRYFQELSYQQITEVMDLQYQTVRDLIHKAIKTLRQQMKSMLFMSVALTLELFFTL